MLIQDISEIEKFINSLSPDIRANMTANINFLVMSYLSNQKNLSVYSLIDKFITLLSDENKELLSEYVDQISNSVNAQISLSQEETKDVSISFSPENNKSISSDLSEIQSLANELNSKKEKIDDEHLISHTEKITEQELSSIIDYSENDKKIFPNLGFVSIQEYLYNIKPLITDKAKEDIGNLVIDPNTYSLLREFNGEYSIYEIYEHNYSESLFQNYLLTTVIPFYAKGYISLNKSQKFNFDNISKLRIGEILLSFNIIDKTKLDELLKKQKETNTPKKKPKSLSSAMYDISVAEQLTQDAPNNTKKQLGEFVVQQNILSKEELDKILIIQKWFNHLL